VLDLVGGLLDRFRDFWLGMGRLETRLLSPRLQQIDVRMPIFVAGLARSGSTLLHEVISAHPRVATHRVKDFPMVFTPYWWRRATTNHRPQAPRERAHQDRVMITPESPDALDEMLWMAFFRDCHEPAVSNLLDSATRQTAFEAFYRSHIGKLLLVEDGMRYAAKNNYHVARLPYLLRLFPVARIVLPIRAPAGHVASMLRQQRVFGAGLHGNGRALRYMQRSGHFEFGRDRRPVNLGDRDRTDAIRQAWATGDEVRGWARYWSMVYDFVGRILAEDAQVRAATIVVRFETMCAAPKETIQAVLSHCALQEGQALITEYAGRIGHPTYYTNPLSPADVAAIRDETADTARHWGYEG
jgi:hypothetical protein